MAYAPITQPKSLPSTALTYIEPNAQILAMMELFQHQMMESQ